MEVGERWSAGENGGGKEAEGGPGSRDTPRSRHWATEGKGGKGGRGGRGGEIGKKKDGDRHALVKGGWAGGGGVSEGEGHRGEERRDKGRATNSAKDERRIGEGEGWKEGALLPGAGT